MRSTAAAGCSPYIFTTRLTAPFMPPYWPETTHTLSPGSGNDSVISSCLSAGLS
jgi:hypothetical protein